MSVDFVQFSELLNDALNETKNGGDTSKGLVLAILALAEAVHDSGKEIANAVDDAAAQLHP